MPIQPEDIEVVSSEDRDELVEATGEYWNDERISLATPIEAEDEIVPLVSSFTAEPWYQEGSLTQMEEIPADGEEIEDDLEEGQRPLNVNFTTRRVPDRSRLPFSAVGKLFMAFGGEDHVGSAWVVAERAVFTAGHCIFHRRNGIWADHVLFIPQYDNGIEPVGRWAATSLYSLRGWTRNRNFEYDMGVFVVDRKIRPRTGSLGWMANYPPNQGPYKSIGYPARAISGYSFSGSSMWMCDGGYITGRNPIKMHNNMTEGCSGGPWRVVNNGKRYINGLNSFRMKGESNTLQSPYFGDGFLNLYNEVKNK